MTTSDNDTTPQRCCSKCRRWYPLTSEHFAKNKSKKYGLDYRCKKCMAEKSKQWYADNPERKHESDRKRYYANREKHIARVRAWYFSDPDARYATRQKRYYADPEKYREKSRLWAAAHKEELAEKRRQWTAANREYVRHRLQHRRSKRRLLPSTLTEEQWKRCLDYFHNCCAYCGAQQSLWHTIAKEHVTPAASGGGYTASNIIPACKPCNSSKGDKPVTEWVIWKFGKRKGAQILARIQTYFDSLKKDNTP